MPRVRHQKSQVWFPTGRGVVQSSKSAMGQSGSNTWLSAPLAKELLDELGKYSLQAGRERSILHLTVLRVGLRPALLEGSS